MDAVKTWAPNIPFWDRCVTFARVFRGEISFTQLKTVKKEILKTASAEMDEGAVFFVAWTGKWRSDLFLMTKDVVKQLSEGLL